MDKLLLIAKRDNLVTLALNLVNFIQLHTTEEEDEINAEAILAKIRIACEDLDKRIRENY